MSRQPKWNKYTQSLPAGHGWRCAPGYNLFIADRGALRFEFPDGWHTAPPGEDGAIGFHDRPPPADDCSLRASLVHLPPGLSAADVDRAAPLEAMIAEAARHDTRGVAWDGTVHRHARPGAQVVWVHLTFTDPDEHRAARSRTCMARGPGVQGLVTMDYWDDMAEQFEPIWTHMLDTLYVAVPVASLSGESAN